MSSKQCLGLKMYLPPAGGAVDACPLAWKCQAGNGLPACNKSDETTPSAQVCCLCCATGNNWQDAYAPDHTCSWLAGTLKWDQMGHSNLQGAFSMNLNDVLSCPANEWICMGPEPASLLPGF